MNKTYTPDAEVLRWALELRQGLHRETNSRRLFRRFYPGFCFFFERRGFSQEAEDLAQEAIHKALANIESFQGDSYPALRSWLNTIAKHCARNHRRFKSQLRRHGDEISLDASTMTWGLEGLASSAEPRPDRATFGRERLAAAVQVIRKMPEKQRLCALAHFIQDRDQDEISELLKIAAGTVRAHIFHARQHLRAELGEDFEAWKE